uniref:HK97-gp10 family putative phage morphogenesis protein n=1 Tax=Castellaniella defragrans TaxID=75697 RepID=UPI00333F362C
MMVESAIKFDFEEAFKRLDGLAEVAKQHLPRSIIVAAGKIVRDEAKARAPAQSGTLRDAIYLAFSEDRSNPENGQFTYSVTWNASKAPHGHLLEFGHWRYNRPNGEGGWMNSLRPGRTKGDGESSHQGPGKELVPVWTPAYPFLRPAYDAVINIALQAGLDRGRERMAEILTNPSILEQYANGSGSGTVQPAEIAG